MTFRRLLAWACVGLIVGCGLIACQDRRPLRFGINLWPPDELLYLAQEKGFFRDEGVEVRLVEFDTLADERRAFEHGKIAGLATTPVETLLARDQSGRDVRILLVTDVSHGADRIIARNDITKPAELRGKRIGVEPGSLGLYVLSRALELASLSLDDVHIVALPIPRMNRNLAAGKVDAIVTFPPYSHEVSRDPRFHSVFDSSSIPGEILDVLAFDAEFLRQNEQDVDAFLRAYRRAFAYLREHPEDATRIMGRREHLSAEEFARSLSDGITLVGPDEQEPYLRPGGTLQRSLEGISRTLYANGLLSRPADVAGCVGRP